MQGLLPIILSMIEAAIKLEPNFEKTLRDLFSKPLVSPADWEAKREEIKADTYLSIVTNSDLPGKDTPNA